MSDTMLVVSSALKVALKLIEADAPVVAFPDGATVSEYGVDSETPQIVVLNTTDGTYQGASARKGGVVLVNNVPPAIAEVMLDIVEAGGGSTASIVQALVYEAKHGKGDAYTSTVGWFDKNLSPAGRMIGGHSGVVKRDARDQVEIYRDPDGRIRVVHSDGVRDIDPDILVETYRNPDGSTIDLDKIPYKN